MYDRIQGNTRRYNDDRSTWWTGQYPGVATEPARIQHRQQQMIGSDQLQRVQSLTILRAVDDGRLNGTAIGTTNSATINIGLR